MEALLGLCEIFGLGLGTVGDFRFQVLQGSRLMVVQAEPPSCKVKNLEVTNPHCALQTVSPKRPLWRLELGRLSANRIINLESPTPCNR